MSGRLQGQKVGSGVQGSVGSALSFLMAFGTLAQLEGMPRVCRGNYSLKCGSCSGWLGWLPGVREAQDM